MVGLMTKTFTRINNNMCDRFEQKQQYGCTQVRAEVWNVHHKGILQIADFNSKTCIPVSSPLHGMVTYIVEEKHLKYPKLNFLYSNRCPDGDGCQTIKNILTRLSKSGCQETTNLVYNTGTQIDENKKALWLAVWKPATYS